MKFHIALLGSAAAMALAACETATLDDGSTEASLVAAEAEAQPAEPAEPAGEAMMVVEADAEPAADEAMPSKEPGAKLQAVLDAQSDETKARYGARNPAETLAFFGIEPGMTVVEALPGRGWYSQILVPYLGADATLIAAHYPDDMWMKILPNADEERVANIIAFNEGWVERTGEMAGEDGPELQAYKMTTLGDDKADKVDAILFVRALHNLHRVEGELGYFTTTIEESYRLLKPGGVVGVVQHRAPESASDDWADGNAGYLKESRIVSAFEAAGFVLEASSEVNANPKDQPGEGDIVWRLPPSFGTTEEGTPEREAMQAIGESDRMTLRFRKPA